MRIGGKLPLQQIYKRCLTQEFTTNSPTKTVQQLGTWLKAAGQDCVGEVFLRWIVPIMGDVTVHDGPEPLDGIEMRAIGRQWDQMNATVFARQERSDIGAFVV